MTKEEEIRVNVAVNIVRGSFDAMTNQCIEIGTKAEMLNLRVQELEKEKLELTEKLKAAQSGEA